MLNVNGGKDAQCICKKPEHSGDKKRIPDPTGEKNAQKNENTEADPEAKDAFIENDVKVEAIVGKKHRHCRNIVFNCQLCVVQKVLVVKQKTFFKMFIYRKRLCHKLFGYEVCLKFGRRHPVPTFI